MYCSCFEIKNSCTSSCINRNRSLLTATVLVVVLFSVVGSSKSEDTNYVGKDTIYMLF